MVYLNSLAQRFKFLSTLGSFLTVLLVIHIVQVRGDYNRIVECAKGGIFSGINIYKNSDAQIEGINFVCSRQDITVQGAGTQKPEYYLGNTPQNPQQVVQGLCNKGYALTDVKAIYQKKKTKVGLKFSVQPLEGFQIQCCSLPENSCNNQNKTWQASECQTKIIGLQNIDSVSQLYKSSNLKIDDTQAKLCEQNQVISSIQASYIDKSGIWNLQTSSCKNITLRISKGTDDCSQYKDVQCQGVAADYCYQVMPQTPQELQQFPFGYYTCEIAGKSLKTMPGEVLESDFQDTDYSSQCAKTQELNGGWFLLRSQNLNTCLKLSAEGWQNFSPCNQTDQGQWLRFNDPNLLRNVSTLSFPGYENLESALFPGRCVEPPMGGSFIISPSKTSPYQQASISINPQSSQVQYKNGSYSNVNTIYTDGQVYGGQMWEFLQIGGDKTGGAFLRNPESGLCMSKQKDGTKNPVRNIFAVECDPTDQNQRWSLAPAKSKLGMNLVDDQLSCIAFPDPTNATQSGDQSGLVLISQFSCQNELQSLAAFEILSIATDAGSCLTSSAFFRYNSQSQQMQMSIANLTSEQCITGNQDTDGTQYIGVKTCPSDDNISFKFDLVPVNVGKTWQEESKVFNRLVGSMGIAALSPQQSNNLQVTPVDFGQLTATNLSSSVHLLQSRPGYCSWSFVRCDLYGRVLSVQLNVFAGLNLGYKMALDSQLFGLTNMLAFSACNLHLVGDFPATVDTVLPLRSFDLSNTTLSGPAPSTWPSYLQQLQFLSLQKTQITGQIQEQYFDIKSFNANTSILVETGNPPPASILCTAKDFETMPQRFPLGAYKNQPVNLCPDIYDMSKLFLITYKINAPKCLKCNDIRLQLGTQYGQSLQNYSYWDQSTFTTNCSFDNPSSKCAQASDSKSMEGLRKRALLQSNSGQDSSQITVYVNGYFTDTPSRVAELASSIQESFEAYSQDQHFTSGQMQIMYGTQVLASLEPMQKQRVQLTSGYISLIAVVGFIVLLGLGVLAYFLYRRKDRQKYYQAKLKKKNLAKFNKMGGMEQQLGQSLLYSRSSQEDKGNQQEKDLLQTSLSQALRFYSHIGQQSKLKASEVSQQNVPQTSKLGKLGPQQVSPVHTLKGRSKKLLSTKSSNLISMSSMSSGSSASTLVIRMSSGQNFQDQMDRALHKDRTTSIDPRQYENQLDKIEEDIQDMPNQNVLAQAARAAQVKGSQLLMNATNLMQLYYSQVNKPRYPGQGTSSPQEEGERPPPVRKVSPPKKYDYSISQILDTTSTTNGDSNQSPTSVYITKTVGPEFLDFQIRLVIKMLNDQYEIVEPIESYQHLGSQSYIIFVKKNLLLGGSKGTSEEIQPAADQQPQQPQQPPSKSFQIYAIKIYFDQNSFDREVSIYKTGNLRNVVPTVQQIHHGNTTALTRYTELRQQEEGQQALEMIQDSNNTNLCLPFMVLEAGETLRSWQKRHKDRAMNQARYIMCQVGNLVQTLHQNGIVHGNLSTSHIVWDDTVKAWKLIDFSCSCPVFNPQMPHMRHLGVPIKYHFSPPEVVLTANPSQIMSDPKVDVWALGMIAYNLYTTEAFFHSKVKNEIIAQYLQDFRRFARRLEVGKLSKQLEQVGQVIMQMLGKSPKYRPSVEQAMKQLEQCSEAMWNQKQVKLMLGAMAHWPEKGQESTGVVSTKYLNVQISIKQDPADDVSDKVALLQYSSEKGDDIPTFGIVPGTPFYLNFRLSARNVDDLPIDIPLSSTRVVIMDIKKPQKGQILILIPNMLATSSEMWEFQALWDPTKHNIDALNEDNTESVHLEGVVNLVVIQQIKEEMVERVIRLSKRVRFQTMSLPQITQFKQQQQGSSTSQLQNNTFNVKFSVDE